MHRSMLSGLATLLAVGPAIARAQDTAHATAPLPAQIISAQRVFIANGGAETYGSETYFTLTKYAGGPDRLYTQFYSAMQRSNRYTLVGAPADAQLVLDVRFENPIVQDLAPRNRYEGERVVRDPQLDLAILDPSTRITLWSVVEHIQPADDDSAANDRNFDAAVTRLVADVDRLGATSRIALDTRDQAGAYVPVGAVDAARAQEREHHARVGAAVGLFAGGFEALGLMSTCGDINTCTPTRGTQRVLEGVTLGLTTAAAGALIGWLWPTGY